LDSGDLAYLSIEARKILDAAGFDDAVIVASNNLDEYIIDSLKRQGAKIDIWGVGTKLVTAYDQPALGGVYKLGAIQVDETWRPRIKLSEQASKVTTPGRLHVRRFTDGDTHVGDLIYDPDLGVSSPVEIVDPQDATRRKKVSSELSARELLVPIFRDGNRIYEEPTLEEVRALNRADMGRFHPTIKRFMNAHEYPVGLEKNLHRLRTNLVLKARGHDAEGGRD
jgi:nicotinate phosphoribosyltransferase